MGIFEDLRQAGYTGTLADMQYKYLSDRSGLIRATMADMMRTLGLPVRHVLVSIEFEGTAPVPETPETETPDTPPPPGEEPPPAEEPTEPVPEEPEPPPAEPPTTEPTPPTVPTTGGGTQGQTQYMWSLSGVT